MNNYIALARRMDFLLGFVFAASALYCAVTQSFLLAAVLAASSAVSFLSAKVVPARWVMKRILLARLKA